MNHEASSSGDKFKIIRKNTRKVQSDGEDTFQGMLNKKPAPATVEKEMSMSKKSISEKSMSKKSSGKKSQSSSKQKNKIA